MTFKQVVELFKKGLLICIMVSVTTFIGCAIYWTWVSMLRLWLVHPSVTLFHGAGVIGLAAGVALFVTEVLE